jgi:hypothetical protein
MNLNELIIELLKLQEQGKGEYNIIDLEFNCALDKNNICIFNKHKEIGIGLI